MKAIIESNGVAHGAVEAGRRCPLAIIFGTVDVQRLAYRRGHSNLHPADALLNPPAERHSHGLRRLAVVEAPRESFEEALAALERATGQHVCERHGSKGIVIRHDSLREQTAKAAAAARTSSPRAFQKARSATASAWQRSVPSTT